MEHPRSDLRRALQAQISMGHRRRIHITRELEEIAGHVNGAFAELDWTPVRYIHRAVPRVELARLYRKASACLVTSFADGMNLVAKEFVAAQDPENPGVLLLSRFAGAAEDMTEALQINPYDIEDIAAAIGTALEMPLAERLRRHKACLDVVRKTDVAKWSTDFLRVLMTCGAATNFRDFETRGAW